MSVFDPKPATPKPAAAAPAPAPVPGPTDTHYTINTWCNNCCAIGTASIQKGTTTGDFLKDYQCPSCGVKEVRQVKGVQPV
jgi:hypothetical protein